MTPGTNGVSGTNGTAYISGAEGAFASIKGSLLEYVAERAAIYEDEAKRKRTRRDRFLGEMKRVVPWAALLATIAPYYYPKAGQGRVRPPIGLERMLRIYFL